MEEQKFDYSRCIKLEKWFSITPIKTELKVIKVKNIETFISPWQNVYGKTKKNKE